MSAWLKATLLAIIAVFAPVKPMMITAGVLIILDLILGIIAAKKRGEPISSAAMRRTVSKMLIYQTGIMIGFLMEQYLLGGLIPVSKLVASVIAITEGKSCFENLDAINGSSVFKSIIEKLGSNNDIQPPSSGNEP